MGLPFTEERREYVNTKELRGGEIPLPGKKTPEEIAHHVEVMVCSFWDHPRTLEHSNAELVYTIALGALRRMQELTRLEALPKNNDAEGST